MAIMPFPGNMPPFPPFPPMPPLPVPPGGPTTDTFDLTAIDTATEALVMPGADLLADMMIASSPSRRGKVTVECGSQKLEYQLTHSPCSKEITGNINGQPFSVGMKQLPGATYITGMTPGGPLAETINYMPGSISAAGTSGGLDYNQTYVADPTANMTGHIGVLSGSVGPSGNPAPGGLGVELTASPDGNGYLLNGYIGDKPLSGTMKNVAPGVVQIDRNVGGNQIKQTIQFG